MSRVVEVAAEVLEEHAYTPRASQCACGIRYFGMTHKHRQHVAEVIAERLGGVERVEWGVRFGDGEVYEFEDRQQAACEIVTLRQIRSDADLDENYEPMSVVKRTVVTIKGEWEAG